MLKILGLLVIIEENDESPMVRKEIALHVLLAVKEIRNDMHRSPQARDVNIVETIFLLLASLENDPHPVVSGYAREARSLISPEQKQPQPASTQGEHRRRKRSNRSPTQILFVGP